MKLTVLSDSEWHREMVIIAMFFECLKKYLERGGLYQWIQSSEP